MTAVVSAYFMGAPECMGLVWAQLPKDSYLHSNFYGFSVIFGIVLALTAAFLFYYHKNKIQKNEESEKSIVIKQDK